MSERLVLSEMTWPEVERQLPHIKVAVVPVGSCEQHGPNTTFTTDTDRADAFSKLLAERVGNKILVLPPFGYGMSMHHMGFPVTVTLRVETMIHALTDIAEAVARHGLRKILFINGHGGNRMVLESVVNALKYDHDIDAYWSSMGTNIYRREIEKDLPLPRVIGHACEVETAQSMYLAPWVVKGPLEKGQVVEDSLYHRRVLIDGGTAWDWKRDASANGALGDARRATPELGEKMTKLSLDYMEGLIEEIIAR